MKIDRQLESARKAVKREAKDLPFDLPITWYCEMMTGYVFMYLIKARIRHDRGQGCSYDKVMNLAKSYNLSVHPYTKTNPWSYNEFSIKMENMAYQISERDDSWTAFPILSVYPHDYYYGFAVGYISADSFLRFLSEFDSVISEINRAATALHLEMAKKRTSESILLSTIQLLMEEHLEEAGISYEYQLRDDGVVIWMPLRKKICIRTRIPAQDIGSRIPELPSLFANPDKGMEKYGKDFRYERYRIRFEK